MLGFIIAAVAGFLTPHIEGPVAEPIVKALQGRIPVEASEKRLIAFMVAMLGAGVAAALLDSGTPFWMIVGGVLGYFATRIMAAGQKLIDARNSKR
ncbi:hypothetical protein [Yoonia sp.]|uniref:hypothetical protein n=1 Tax=Yoonia sp. TaxID=2212373 RepID=UPI0025E2DB4E|nr:hypothetical protein [Yoonia sp.]